MEVLRPPISPTDASFARAHFGNPRLTSSDASVAAGSRDPRWRSSSGLRGSFDSSAASAHPMLPSLRSSIDTSASSSRPMYSPSSTAASTAEPMDIDDRSYAVSQAASSPGADSLTSTVWTSMAAPKGRGRARSEVELPSGKGKEGQVAFRMPRYAKRSRRPAASSCHCCGTAETPEWRKGPSGSRTLCNACGLHYAKVLRQERTASGNANVVVDIEKLRRSIELSLNPGTTSPKQLPSETG